MHGLISDRFLKRFSGSLKRRHNLAASIDKMQSQETAENPANTTINEMPERNLNKECAAKTDEIHPEKTTNQAENFHPDDEKKPETDRR